MSKAEKLYLLELIHEYCLKVVFRLESYCPAEKAQRQVDAHPHLGEIYLAHKSQWSRRNAIMACLFCWALFVLEARCRYSLAWFNRVWWHILFLQISRLIEMQTPLYLEHVQHAHPSFQLQGSAVASNNRTCVSQCAPSVWQEAALLSGCTIVKFVCRNADN